MICNSCWKLCGWHSSFADIAYSATMLCPQRLGYNTIEKKGFSFSAKFCRNSGEGFHWDYCSFPFTSFFWKCPTKERLTNLSSPTPLPDLFNCVGTWNITSNFVHPTNRLTSPIDVVKKNSQGVFQFIVIVFWWKFFSL